MSDREYTPWPAIDGGGEGGVFDYYDQGSGVPGLFVKHFSGFATRLLPDLNRSPLSVWVSVRSLWAFLSREPLLSASKFGPVRFEDPCWGVCTAPLRCFLSPAQRGVTLAFQAASYVDVYSQFWGAGLFGEFVLCRMCLLWG